MHQWNGNTYSVEGTFKNYVKNKTDIRGIRMIASWGENKCEYAFIIKTDAK